MRSKDAPRNAVSGIRDLEYTEPAVHPLPESRRPEHGTADCGRHRAYSAGRNEARAVFRRGEVEGGRTRFQDRDATRPLEALGPST